MERYKIKKYLVMVIIFIIFLNTLFVSGCSMRNCEYKAPQKYYAQMTMTTYSDTEKQNIIYDMKTLYNNNEYKIKISYEDINLFINLVDGKYTVVNDKYKENEILTGSSIFDGLIKEISLDKFSGIKSEVQGLVEYQEDNYRYVLEYNSRNFAPNKLLIYKDDTLIKTFEYNNLEMYK